VSESDESPALEHEPAGQPASGLTPVRVRRSPRYGRFLLTGAAVGVLVALVASLAGPVAADSSRGSLLGYLTMLLGLIGGLLGGVVAVVAEWAARRRQ
jgi:hypothetical protein